jgi:hypothetical protein
MPPTGSGGNAFTGWTPQNGQTQCYLLAPGIISGSPTAVGESTFQIQSTASNGTASFNFLSNQFGMNVQVPLAILRRNTTPMEMI